MGKVIFLDIDGTIRDFNGTIPASAIEAIRQARRNGHEVVINSGRIYQRIDKEIKDIGFDGMVSSSGGYVEYHGKCVAHSYFTQLACIELLEYLLRNHCVVEMANDYRSYVFRKNWEEYQAIGKRICQNIVLDTEQWEISEIVDLLMEVPEIGKLIVFSNELTGKEIVSKWGYSFHITNLSVPHEEKWAGEITPNYTTKVEGIRQILKVTGRKKADVIAIGDHDNDIEMIRFAGVGVAMGNGTKRAKEAADYVTEPLREDGLWKAFVHLGLIKEED